MIKKGNAKRKGKGNRVLNDSKKGKERENQMKGNGMENDRKQKEGHRKRKVNCGNENEYRKVEKEVINEQVNKMGKGNRRIEKERKWNQKKERN